LVTRFTALGIVVALLVYLVLGRKLDEEIYDALRRRGASSITDLAAAVGRPLREVRIALERMERKGLVRRYRIGADDYYDVA
jgi:predicted transcriptional regulator